MAMEKNSAEGKVCTFCGKDALPGTDPAVCEEHILQTKEASSEDKPAETLKELDAKE